MNKKGWGGVGWGNHIQYTYIILPITEKVLSVNISYKYLLTIVNEMTITAKIEFTLIHSVLVYVYMYF